jgi:hypothetical protein
VLVAIDADGREEGQILCPACDGGALRFSIAPGRMGGIACSTAGCVRMIS